MMVAFIVKVGLIFQTIFIVCLEISISCYVFPADVKNPCVGRKCSFGAVCVSSLDGLSARCQCPDKCYNFGDNDDGQPLCGTDGVDYGNACELRRTSCREMRDIFKKYDGNCDPCRGVACPDKQICRLDARRNPVCQCLNVCSNTYSPVCASDGRTYDNKCFVELDGCRSKRLLKVIHSGNCSEGNICQKMKCDFYSECHLSHDEKPRCVCLESCEKLIRPLCASDGRSYDNMCEMKRRSCVLKKWITFSKAGLCENQLLDVPSITSHEAPCSEVDCPYGGECVLHFGRTACRCPNCSNAAEDPVCGSDGKTYKSECELKMKSCSFNEKLKVKYKGPCVNCERSMFGCCPEDPGHSALGPNAAGCPSSCQCNVIGSLGTECDHVDLQCRCKPGVGGSKCDRCETSFWGFSNIIERKDGCMPCNCSEVGSSRSDCDQSTGKCRCKPGFSGQQCHVCPNGSFVRHNSCSGSKIVVESSGCHEECKFGGKCVQLGKTFGCVCPATCHEKDVTPVCAGDGTTYKSMCHVEQAACSLRRYIIVSHVGSCTNNSSTQVSVKMSGFNFYEFQRKLRDGRRTSIKMDLKTIASEGLIFLEAKSMSTSSDFIAIGLQSGRLKVIFNLGKDSPGTLPTIDSIVKINDNHWHSVLVERKGRMLKLLIDDEKAQVTHSTAGAVNFHSKGFFMLGGSAKEVEDLPSTFKKMFRGCLREISIDSENLNLFKRNVNFEHCD